MNGESPVRDDVIVRVDGVSKKFCRTLKRSLWYGIQDVVAELVAREIRPHGLRPAEFWAVDDVSFQLRRGECLGLIGHNGAGKSTLLKMLNGLIKPDRGRIEMVGRVSSLIELGAGFNPVLTGRENIYVNGAVLGMARKEIDAKFSAVVDFAEIGDFIDAPVQSYSTGMKVRRGIRLAGHGPRVEDVLEPAVPRPRSVQVSRQRCAARARARSAELPRAAKTGAGLGSGDRRNRRRPSHCRRSVLFRRFVCACQRLSDAGDARIASRQCTAFAGPARLSEDARRSAAGRCRLLLRLRWAAALVRRRVPQPGDFDSGSVSQPRSSHHNHDRHGCRNEGDLRPDHERVFVHGSKPDPRVGRLRRAGDLAGRLTVVVVDVKPPRVPSGEDRRQPMVSVCMMTYNHRAFIGQALDSVLAQETSFPFEVCLGEDASDDGTRDICCQYARRHPDVIRLFLRRRCDVIQIHGRPTGRFNFTETFRACRGRYIALLEGDDFWIAKDKLQRQVDVLEENSAIAVCGRDVECVDRHGAALDGPCVRPPERPVSTTADLLERNFLPTASIMLRNGIVETFPDWFYGLRMADWPLALLASKGGDIFFLPEKMAAYRKHAAGIWSVMDSVEKHSAETEFYRAIRNVLDGRLKRLAFEKEHRSAAYVANLEGRYRRARWHRLLAAAAQGPSGFVSLVRDRLAWGGSGTDGS